MTKKYILGIDTATKQCSVTLTRNEDILASESGIGRAVHNQKLAGFIDTVMQKSEVNFQQLDGIAVNIGPGSFTGLRIGLSTAKGLAFPHDIPILPISAFTILQKSAASQEGKSLLFIRSHKDNIYYQIHNSKSDLNLSPSIDYSTVEEVITAHPEVNTFLGNHEFEAFLQKNNMEILYPHSRYSCQIGYRFFDELAQKSSPELEPYYLTNFEAKKWKPGVKSGSN